MGQLTSLQNGSDIRGVAVYGVRGENVNLTIIEARKIAAAFAIWLKRGLAKETPRIAVGRDTRISGDELKEGVTEGLNMAGAMVFDFGFASTPCMYMCTLDNELICDGAVMITGSHLPYNHNGMKFFTREGATGSHDVADILEIAENIEEDGIDIRTVKKDYMSTYAKNLADFIRQQTMMDRPFENLKIIVDAGNGVGGFFVDKLLRPLGANTAGSKYLEHNGMFPHHVPDPELPGVMEQFKSNVLDYKADLGILFDTDADRAALVDGDGIIFNRDRLVALMSALVLRDHPGTAVVTDSVTSDGLTRFIEAKGGVHHRFRRGYKYIIDECKRLNREGTPSAMAMETSGHCALQENHYLDDGAYMVARLLIEFVRLRAEGKKLSDLIEDLEEPAETEEYRLVIAAGDYDEYAEKILRDFEEEAQKAEGIEIEPGAEGVRAHFGSGAGNGWCLLRQSLHGPKLCVYIQSDEAGGAQKIREFLRIFLSRYNKLVLKQQERAAAVR